MLENVMVAQNQKVQKTKSIYFLILVPGGPPPPISYQRIPHFIQLYISVANVHENVCKLLFAQHGGWDFVSWFVFAGFGDEDLFGKSMNSANSNAATTEISLVD